VPQDDTERMQEY